MISKYNILEKAITGDSKKNQCLPGSMRGGME